MDQTTAGGEEVSPEDAVIILQQQQGEGWAEVGPMESGRYRKKGPARETSLTAQCLICTGPAAAHQHYGAVCCYSCRAFFRRGITRSYVCVRGDDLCQVNSITRTNCKRCRYARCLAVGMKPELVDATLKRKQEERRRQEIQELQHEVMPRNGVQQLLHAQQVLAAVQGIQQPHAGVDPIAATEVGDRPDDAMLYQAMEGKKKVLLELRQDQMQQPRVMEQHIQQVEEPQAAPLRQQTYYIFHPPTQTFEPITIAEFEESDVIEEVVVAEDYSVAKLEDGMMVGKQEEDMMTVVNEHDYVEVPAEGGLAQVAKRPRLSEEEVESKPMVSHVIPTATEVKVESGQAQVSVIRRLLPAAPTPAPAPYPPHAVSAPPPAPASEPILERVPAPLPAPPSAPARATRQLSSDLRRVIEDTIGSPINSTVEVVVEQEQVVAQEETEDQVDIEKLVDFCFEEELHQKPKVSPAEEVTPEEVDSKPLVVKRTKVIQRARRRSSGKRRRQPGSPLPLKKRRKMYHYPIAMAINRHQIPQLNFTIEEEFRLHDLVARVDHIQMMFYTELSKCSPELMNKSINSLVNSLKRNQKIKDNEEDMEKMYNIQRELFASKSKDVFDEFRSLKKTVAYRMQYTNWPALQCLELAAFFGNKKKGLKEQCQFLGGTNCYDLMAKACPEVYTLPDRGLCLQDYYMFSSPWALTMNDEVFFEKTIKELGELLADDRKLIVAFQMLLMATKPPGEKQNNKAIRTIQGDLAQLLYRYLISTLGVEESAEKAYTLVGYLNKLHRCGDIIMNRRIKMLPEETEMILPK